MPRRPYDVIMYTLLMLLWSVMYLILHHCMHSDVSWCLLAIGRLAASVMLMPAGNIVASCTFDTLMWGWFTQTGVIHSGCGVTAASLVNTGLA